MRNAPNLLQADEARQLADLLGRELTHYRRLLRLAWRQNSYMKRQDVDRLAANGRDWGRWIPAADGARLERERLVAALGQRLGVAIPPGRVGDLLDYAGAGNRGEITALLGAIRQTAGKLARQNALNRQLAEFCLELAHEEAEIFKRCVMADPSGRYRGDARQNDRGPGGVLVRQA
ncbi:flagellar protein FlgN [bacterium]|nr:flagellar protein FlgN [bacterium]